MIGFLRGTIDTVTTNYLIIDTGNIGYKVLVSNSLLSKVRKGSNLKLYTFTYVREDILELFGFENHEDLVLFELFLTISGIGPKTALGIFAKGTFSQITNAIVSNDVDFFSGIPRLGRKNAQKIIIELSGKIGDATVTLDFQAQDEEKEISIALKEFGFAHDEISQTLKKVRSEKGTVEQKLKLALKYLAK